MLTLHSMQNNCNMYLTGNLLQADKLQDSSLKNLLAEQSRLKRAIKAEKENKGILTPWSPRLLSATESAHSAMQSGVQQQTGNLSEESSHPSTQSEELSQSSAVLSEESVHLAGQSEESGHLAGQSEESAYLAGQSEESVHLGGQPEESGHLAGQSEVSLREIEEKLREIVVAMEDKRIRGCRPYDLLAMSLEQLCEEKAEMQVLLLGKPFIGIAAR